MHDLVVILAMGLTNVWQMSDRFARKVFDLYMDCPGNLGDITYSCHLGSVAKPGDDLSLQFSW